MRDPTVPRLFFHGVVPPREKVELEASPALTPELLAGDGTLRVPFLGTSLVILGPGGEEHEPPDANLYVVGARSDERQLVAGMPDPGGAGISAIVFAASSLGCGFSWGPARVGERLRVAFYNDGSAPLDVRAELEGMVLRGAR